jgi:hypothetical protein
MEVNGIILAFWHSWSSSVSETKELALKIWRNNPGAHAGSGNIDLPFSRLISKKSLNFLDIVFMAIFHSQILI